MRHVFLCLAFVLFLLMLGTVGGIERGNIASDVGFIRAIIFAVLMAGSLFLSGAFKCDYEELNDD